jgi:ATP-binding cassette, subfamily B, bacterial
VSELVTDEKQETDLQHLPDGLLEAVRRNVDLADILASAGLDLDADGRYGWGQLLLTREQLGVFYCSNGHPTLGKVKQQDDGQWEGKWLPLEDIEKAEVVEGLGVSVLRLTARESIVAEYRYTLRHAREVARLHRRIERIKEGKADEPEPPRDEPREDKKKVRCEKCGRAIPPWTENCPACMVRRKILFRLMDFVKPYKGRAALGASLAILTTLLGLVGPWIRKPLVDRGLGGAEGADPNMSLLLLFLGLMAGVMFAGAAVRGFQGWLMSSLGSRVARGVRDTTYAHMHKLSLSFFQRRQTGNLTARISNDSDRLWDFIAWTLVQVSTSMLTLVGVGVAMFIMNWRLALFVLIPIPVMVALTVVFHKRLHRFFRRIHHRWGQMVAVVAGALPGVRVIKAFSQEGREVDRFGEKNRQVYDEEMKMISTGAIFGPLMELCTNLSMMTIWLVGGIWIVRDHMNPPANPADAMTIGTLLAFIGYMMMFYRPIHMIAHMDRMFNRAATSAQRIFEVLDTEPAIFSKAGAHRPDELNGKIELRDVTFSYDGIRPVLKHVNLTIQPGEMIGLAGPSGGGKTTLVNLICRFYDVLEGEILIDDVSLKDYDIDSLRHRVGVVLQEPFLFHGTVAENIAYGQPDATLEQIIESARAANAHDFIVGFPDGYDTLVGERGQSLSGGERQRISIARAILSNPKILILDEATSSVDTETEKLIQEALDRLISDRTTIAIAHRLSTLRKASRLVILEKGDIIEQGTHEELAKKDGGLYAKLLNMQAEAKSLIALSD